MSEFKFACPVCGQHMMCDASQAGTVMECPTCFQKITAPQAPASDAKFILTGTKVSEKKISVRGMDVSVVSEPEKNIPAGIFIAVLVAVCIAAVAAVLFIHKNQKPVAVETPVPPPLAQKPPTVEAAPVKSAVAAVHASDTNWTLSLAAVATPAAPVAGRIHGQDFIMERAYFSTNGGLTLRAGAHGAVEFGVMINFSGAVPEALAGQTINVTPDTEQAATVNLRWTDDTGVQKQSFNTGYALRLEFGAMVKGKLPGKIYLCMPDAEKSYLMGSFTANISRPKLKNRI
jgi:hypothetical protein